VSRDLLISASPGELRAALVEAGRAVEFWIERIGTGSLVGEIHLGRILRVLPALPAAHVDIGTGRPAFLSQEDAIDLAPEGKRADGIASWVHEGQAILVQVTRDAQGDKAAGVSARLRLAGHLLTLTPTRSKIVVPRICGRERRAEIVALLSGGLRQGYGAVIDLPGLAAPPEAILAEVSALQARWDGLSERARRAEPPAVIESEDDPLGRLLVESVATQPERILVDGRAAYAEARAWFARHRADLSGALVFDDGDGEIFERHGIGDDLASATSLRVALPGRGSLVIEATAAMTVIDVDGGGAVKRSGTSATTILAVNQSAAEEAARQIRLRNLAGAIVVDFISMARRADRDTVLKIFSEALAGDPAQPQILGWTRLGHVELTRRRRRKPLAEILGERGEHGGWTKSAATIALETLRMAARQAARIPARAPVLAVHPEIAAALGGEAGQARRALAADLARPVAVEADPTMPRESFDIRFE
jgi:ribonuclease G